MSIDRAYEQLADALRDHGLEAEYDDRQGVVELRDYPGFFHDLYKDSGDFVLTYVAGDSWTPREPSPPGSGMFTRASMDDLAAEAAEHVKNVNEQLEPIRSKVREVARKVVAEDLQLRSSGTPPSFSIDGYIQQFVRDIIKGFAKKLKSAYDIEFESGTESKHSASAHFEVYNRRQDVMYEGRMFAFVDQGRDEITIQIDGGIVGSDITDYDTVIDTTVPANQDPRERIDIVSAFQILAGR